MDQQELKNVLELHRKWVLGVDGGSRANLSGANLSGAYLSGANLSRANLSDAYLSDAYLSTIKEDFYKILAVAKDEVLCLYDALMKGKVDGSTYEQDGCGCLVGTIALCRNEKHECMTIDLKPDSDRPAERWFLAISIGDLPQNNPVSAVTAEWCREWLTEHGIKYPRYEYPRYEIVAVYE